VGDRLTQVFYTTDKTATFPSAVFQQRNGKQGTGDRERPDDKHSQKCFLWFFIYYMLHLGIGLFGIFNQRGSINIAK